MCIQIHLFLALFFFFYLSTINNKVTTYNSNYSLEFYGMPEAIMVAVLGVVTVTVDDPWSCGESRCCGFCGGDSGVEGRDGREH